MTASVKFLMVGKQSEVPCEGNPEVLESLCRVNREPTTGVYFAKKQQKKLVIILYVARFISNLVLPVHPRPYSCSCPKHGNPDLKFS